MSNAFKRDLRAGRMQPSRRRGDSKAERGAGEGGIGRGQLPAEPALPMEQLFHGRSRSRALSGVVHTKSRRTCGDASGPITAPHPAWPFP